MEELFGLIVWVIIIIAVSVFRKMKREQQQSAQEHGTQAQQSSGPSLQDLLRDLGAELSGTSGEASPREEHRAATERLRRETPPSRKGARDLRQQPTKLEAQEHERLRDKRMRNEPLGEPPAEPAFEQVREMPRRRPRRAARAPIGEASYGARISRANVGDLRQGFIWAEVLGKPVSEREIR